MFKKSKAQPTTSTTHNTTTNGSNERAEVNTLIGSTTTLEGDIRFTGVLKIDGTIIGNLIAENAESVLILDDEGKIEGEIRVPTMIINGVIKGNVYASDKIDLYPKAQIMGDVHYNLLEMEVGAEVNGRMVREEGQTFSSNYEADISSLEPVNNLEDATTEAKAQ